MNETYKTPQLNGLKQSAVQKVLHMIFIVDDSGSMKQDGRMDAVNEAFKKMIPTLKDVQISEQSNYELRISIMKFDQEPEWIVEPTPILEYDHSPIPCSDWVTYYSRAFNVLDQKLSSNAFMAHSGKLAEPYILFMTDGEPTPEDNYQPALNRLLDNGWFQNSVRYAVLMGKEAVNSPLAKQAVSGFVSDPIEGIISATEAEEIASSVEAHTIHVINQMTHHAVGGDTRDNDTVIHDVTPSDIIKTNPVDDDDILKDIVFDDIDFDGTFQ